MKRWLGSIIPGVIVALAFMSVTQIPSPTWRVVGLWGCFMLLNVFYVQRYPKTVALEWSLKLKPGQKVEVEGK